MNLIHVKPQSVFLIVAILWGITNIILTPPFQVPDEPAHFYKSLHIAGGNLFPENSDNQVGGYFPKGTNRIVALFYRGPQDSDYHIHLHDLAEASKIRPDTSAVTFIQFPNTARILPVPYFPQAFGIMIGKLFFNSPLVWFYAGRLFNLLTWIGFIFFAIKIIPVHKWTMVLLALLPMHINLAASQSADAFTNAISFLGIAIFLRLIFSKDYMSWKSVFWMLLVLLLVSLSKNVYITIALLFFLIPKTKFRAIGFYRIALLLLAFIAILGFLAGSFYTSKVYHLVDPGVSFFPHFADSVPPVDHLKQLRFILTNPMEYLFILTDSIRNQWRDLIYSGIGVLGWLNVPLPFWYYSFMAVTVLCMAFFESSENIAVNMKRKLLILSMVISTIILIYTISYLTWTPVGQNTIDGLQGRYFIPILPLVFLLFYNCWLKIPHQARVIVTLFALLISFVVSNVALVEKYWSLL
jgi:uncharacterized membrane protein